VAIPCSRWVISPVRMWVTTGLGAALATDARCDGCLSFLSACRLTSDNLASALCHRMRFDDRQTPALGSERHAKNVRSTISNAAPRRDGLARCSGVNWVGQRGLSLSPPSTLQPGGIHRQCWISRFPMRPSAAGLP